MSADHRFIQSIYDSALSPQTLPDLLQELSDRIGAHGAMIFDCQKINGRREVGLQHLSLVYDREAITDYAARFNDFEVADQDRLADLSSSGNEINLIHDKALIRPGENALPQPNVQAMARRGVSDRFGCLLSKESWDMDRFAFQFLEGRPLPGAEMLREAEVVLTHLAKALSIGRAFSAQAAVRDGVGQYLDGLPIGVGIVTGAGHLAYGNSEFHRIAQDHAEVTLAAGRLGFQGAAAQPELRALMEDQRAHGRHGARPRREAVFVPMGDQDQGLFIEICPIARHPDLDNFGAGARLVSILDSTRNRQVDPSILARFFPLSKSEQAVLHLVTEGHSNAEIAEIRGRSVETVNSQLKSLLRKTSARNRTELVKVAVGLSAVSPSNS